MQNIYGKKIWIFPDGDLPPSGSFDISGHESVIVLNMSEEEAVLSMMLYFTDREPQKDITIKVSSKRVRCIRMDNPNDLNGFVVPRKTQYSICLISSIPVVVQYGRLDTREQPMAFYTNTGYYE